jgi:hypothetical protein
VCSVSDFKKTRSMRCPRCKATMDEVVRIAPVVHQSGLVAYECPGCSYVTGILWLEEDPGGENKDVNA